ncbi:MAG: hypothetical protein M9894_39350 [Planctomycetes bacterium]|nr:hypothetical protein [Planctomycetota bacterium]
MRHDDPLAPPERRLVDAVLARAALGRDDDPRAALADEAAWLALMALGGRVRGDLERLLAGTWWADARREAPDDAPAPAAGAPESARRIRAALALLLREQAAERDTGAAERATAALACVALGCADPAAGRLLQQGLAHLELLDIVKQIPIAARVRALALEFRFRRLGAVPARFVAKVQDLLERLDREGLLAVALRDRAAPEARSHDLFRLALADGDPGLKALLDALAAAERPLSARDLALALGDGATAREVGAACGRLARALEGGPWTLTRAKGRWALRPRAPAGT